MAEARTKAEAAAVRVRHPAARTHYQVFQVSEGIEQPVGPRIFVSGAVSDIAARSLAFSAAVIYHTSARGKLRTSVVRLEAAEEMVLEAEPGAEAGAS